jgi:hypothetical protein
MDLEIGDKVRIINKNFSYIKNPIVVDFTEDLVFVEFITANSGSCMKLNKSDIAK